MGKAQSRAHIRARDWARGRRTTHLALKLVVLVLGLSLVAAGAVMLVLPGPGWAAIFLGLLILASEFPWAARLLDPLRKLARRASAAVRTRRAKTGAPGRT